MKYLIALSLAIASIGPVWAEEGEIDMVTFHFIRADSNGDFVIDKVEFLQKALEQFSKTDLDDDDLLEEDELGDLAKDPEFLDGDKDGSGSLSVEEMIEEKLEDFAAADSNNDGVLNFIEMKTAYQ